MHKRLPIAVLLLAILGCFISSSASAAQPAGCDATVYDSANFMKGDTSSVAAAAKHLESLGADVRVLTVDNFGKFGNLEQYLEQRRKDCKSWQAADGSWKTNMIVFAASLNPHALVIDFGNTGRFNDPLTKNDAAGKVQAGSWKSDFQDGDFSGGFVAGINDTYKVIDNYQNPPPVASKAPSKPTDYSGLWKVLGGLVAAFVLFGLLTYGWVLSRQRQRDNEKRKVAQARALRARDNVTRITTDIGGDTNDTVRKTLVSTYKDAGGNTEQILNKALKDYDSAYSAVVEGMKDARTANSDMEDKGLTEGEYLEGAKRYEAILEDAKKAEAANKTISDIGESLQKSCNELPQSCAALQADIDKLNAELSSLGASGIKVDDIQASSAEAAGLLGQIQTTGPGMVPSLKVLGQAQAKFKEADTALTNMKGQRRQLAIQTPALAARIDEVKQQIDGADKCFMRISETYAESSWKAVRGNGPEAEKRIAAAQESLDKANQLQDLSTQSWGPAMDSINNGIDLLDQAESLLRSITELETHLHKAEKDAPSEISLAEADINKARKYLDDNKGDVNKSHEADVTDAERMLQEAKDELARPKPDFLRVVELALKANSAADLIFAEASDEHETAERQRRLAVTTLNQAEAAVSQADQFIEDHHTDVRGSALSDLDSAKRSLVRARSAKSPDKVIDFASKAANDANQAYTSAQRDFDDAEDERDRERDRYSGGSTYIGVGSIGGYGGSSWGGGGGGLGAGGSIGFGGGGGSGGGGSSSW